MDEHFWEDLYEIFLLFRFLLSFNVECCVGLIVISFGEPKSAWFSSSNEPDRLSLDLYDLSFSEDVPIDVCREKVRAQNGWAAKSL